MLLLFGEISRIRCDWSDRPIRAAPSNVLALGGAKEIALMDEQTVKAQALWMAVLVASAILFSFALACGMPFAALGALAAMAFPLRSAIALAVVGWLANQVIGFSILNYPTDPTTLAWGLALCVSAVGAVFAAKALLHRCTQSHPAILLGGAFMAAWAAQQSVIFAESLSLGGTATAFDPSVVWFILWTNALAFIVLLLAQVLGVRAGFAHPPLSADVR